jgi:hypothetical protein
MKMEPHTIGMMHERVKAFFRGCDKCAPKTLPDGPDGDRINPVF